VAAPTEHRHPTPAGDLCWFEWGSARADKPSLLLLHATGFHARCWDATVERLPVGSHAIAVDLPGHGRSFRPESLSRWVDTASAILPLIDAIAGPALVGVGHSMGGACLTRIAAARPDRFASLVLVDPVIFDPDLYARWPQFGLTNPADHMVAKRRNRWESADAMIARFAPRAPYADWQPRVLADYCRFGLVPAADGDGLELACPPLLEASAYLGSAAFDMLATAASIACPVEIVRARTGERTDGTVDFSISPTWPDLARHMPCATDHHWSDCSHFIPMEAPERLAALIGSQLSR
jgi:pimeloyl-ACP methyl ester carboxylesterase